MTDVQTETGPHAAPDTVPGPDTVRVYFDYSSPYAYLASERIEALAARHGRSVDWRPFLLGAVFKTEGTQPLTTYPLKGRYARHDIERTARRHGVPFVWPPRFPFLSVNAARLTYWAGAGDPEMTARLVHAFFRAAFAEGCDLGHTETTLDAAESAGVDRAAAAAALKDQAVKDRLRAATDSAIATGVFGAPYIVVDGEPFWGHDRLPDIDAWLESGGW